MSQRTGTHDRRTTNEDEELDDLRGRQPGGRQEPRPHEPKEPKEPAEPEADELELAGDDDLGPADLGPAAPGFADPDAPSGRRRRIAAPPSA